MMGQIFEVIEIDRSKIRITHKTFHDCAIVKIWPPHLPVKNDLNKIRQNI